MGLLDPAALASGALVPRLADLPDSLARPQARRARAAVGGGSLACDDTQDRERGWRGGRGRSSTAMRHLASMQVKHCGGALVSLHLLITRFYLLHQGLTPAFTGPPSGLTS